MPSRRAVLLSAGVLLAGCSTLGDGSRTVFDGELGLGPGAYRAVEFDLRRERSVRFGVGELDREIDILLLSGPEFAAYEAGRSFEYRYTSGLSVAGGQAEDSAVPAGEYAVVFDNTDRGAATPDGPISGPAWVEIPPSN